MNPSELNRWLLAKSRLLVYILALVAALFLLVKNPDAPGRNFLPFANDAGFASFIFISLALCVTPIRKIFPRFPFNPTLVYARRAIGISGFAFATLHAVIQFLFFFNANAAAVWTSNAEQGNAYLAGVLGFAILLGLAATSTDFAVRKLGRNWRSLHKTVYIAYPIIIYHAVKTGIDFTHTTITGQLFVLIAILVLTLELARLHKEHENRKTPANGLPVTPPADPPGHQTETTPKKSREPKP